MFNQILDPTGYLALTWLVALAPVALLLVLLAVFRMSAWLATLTGSLVTLLLAVWIWKMPFGDGMRAYLYGSATGVWSDRLDHNLGRGFVQFTRCDWGVREISPLAARSRDSRRAGSNAAFCLGLRRAS